MKGKNTFLVLFTFTALITTTCLANKLFSNNEVKLENTRNSIKQLNLGSFDLQNVGVHVERNLDPENTGNIDGKIIKEYLASLQQQRPAVDPCSSVNDYGILVIVVLSLLLNVIVLLRHICHKRGTFMHNNKGRNGESSDGRRCGNCGLWGRIPWKNTVLGGLLCNACELYHKVNGGNRPILTFTSSGKVNIPTVSSPSHNNARQTGISELGTNLAPGWTRVGNNEAKECWNCGTTAATALVRTTEETTGKTGNSLCTGCGLFVRVDGINRPLPQKIVQMQGRPLLEAVEEPEQWHYSERAKIMEEEERQIIRCKNFENV